PAPGPRDRQRRRPGPSREWPSTPAYDFAASCSDHSSDGSGPGPRCVFLSTDRAGQAVLGFLRLQPERLPNVRTGQRLDMQYHLAVLEDSHRPGRLADRHRDRLGLTTDRRRGPVAAAQSLTQGKPFGRNAQIDATGDGDPVAADQDRAFELREILDRLADAAVAEVTLFPAVTAERVKVQWPRHTQNLPGVA